MHGLFYRILNFKYKIFLFRKLMLKSKRVMSQLKNAFLKKSAQTKLMKIISTIIHYQVFLVD